MPHFIIYYKKNTNWLIVIQTYYIFYWISRSSSSSSSVTNTLNRTILFQINQHFLWAHALIVEQSNFWFLFICMYFRSNIMPRLAKMQMNWGNKIVGNRATTREHDIIAMRCDADCERRISNAAMRREYMPNDWLSLIDFKCLIRFYCLSFLIRWLVGRYIFRDCVYIDPGFDDKISA